MKLQDGEDEDCEGRVRQRDEEVQRWRGPRVKRE